MKSKGTLIFLLVFSWGCAHKQIAGSKSFETNKDNNINKVNKLVMRPGKVEILKFNIPSDFNKAELICRDHQISYYDKNSVGYAYLAESYFSDFKPYQCHLKKDGIELKVAEVSIVEYKFLEETLKVDKKRVFLSKKDLARVLKERIKISKIYSESSPVPYFEGPFISPLDSLITSYYGSARIFNKSKRTQHLGLDFRAAIGVPIPSSNVGKVVVAENLFYSGNSVIIDHGLGIFTMYGHLSKINVSVGDRVLTGQDIGLAGMTGRVTGPHLHWGVKVDSQWVDGFTLIETSNKEFGENHLADSKI